MPINNNLFGVYKTLKVGSKYILASRASRSQTMEVAAKNFIQGTPKNRIMDIGGVKEQISITAPILIGGGSLIDGRSLISERLSNILGNPAGATLPVLKSASISVNQQGSDTQITLLSDGDPSVAATFEVTSATADMLTDGSTSNVLDPMSSSVRPTRVARFYDFRVSISGHTYYVMEAKLQIEVDTVEQYFIGAYSDTSNVPQADFSVGGDTFRSGYQFPTIGVSGIRISGEGKAAVVLRNIDHGTDYDFTDAGDYEGDAEDESINLALGTGTSDLTLQTPGITQYEDDPFKLQVYSGTAWVDLLPGVDLSRSVINKADFSVEPGLLTVDFGFNCWVQ